MSYLPKKTLCLWPLPNISGRNWTFRAENSNTRIDWHVILPKETLCFWPLSKIFGRIYDTWSKIDGVHSRQEKSIWSLLVTLGMIYDYNIMDNNRLSLWLLCTLLWGSGRAARHDNIIWTATVWTFRKNGGFLSLIDRSYSSKEIPQNRPLLNISDRKQTFRSKTSRSIIDRYVILF